jgi:hypothetical protein
LDANFKNEVIKLFKDEKMSVTKILQEELNSQVAELRKEIVNLELTVRIISNRMKIHNLGHLMNIRIR